MKSKQTRLLKIVLSNWSKYLLKFVFVVSELVVGSGEQDANRYILPEAALALRSFRRLFAKKLEALETD